MKDILFQVHFTDGGELTFKERADYGYFDADVYVCSVCGREIDINDGDYVGTREEYEYIIGQGWKPDYVVPRRLYPDYFRLDT